jgi:choline dehydrogenase-like flavoprotein
MGPPGEAVVDRDLRHHQVENLFVAGGSAFPTYSPAHPTLTISALAIRLGDHLAAA